MEREKRPREESADEAVEDREAVADGRTREEIEVDNDDAESRTTFGDDKVTPHLNDGR